MKLLSHVRLFATPWTIAYQAPPFMGFSRQEYWSGLPFPLQGIFSTQGSNPGAGGFFTSWATREALEILGVTGKFDLGVQNEAGQRLTEFCQENALVIANALFQQHKRRLYTWRSPDSQHRNQADYILCSQRWRSSIQSAKTKLGADCGSDHELLIAKFRLKFQ